MLASLFQILLYLFHYLFPYNFSIYYLAQFFNTLSLPTFYLGKNRIGEEEDKATKGLDDFSDDESFAETISSLPPDAQQNEKLGSKGKLIRSLRNTMYVC